MIPQEVVALTTSLFLAVFVASSAALAGYIARRNGRGFVRWFALGLVLCFLAALVFFGALLALRKDLTSPLAGYGGFLLIWTFAPMIALTAGRAAGSRAGSLPGEPQVEAPAPSEGYDGPLSILAQRVWPEGLVLVQRLEHGERFLLRRAGEHDVGLGERRGDAEMAMEALLKAHTTRSG